MADIIFRKGFSIGQPAAEEDGQYLRVCFIDNGVFEIATDLDERKCILVGRTGSGKSAIIEKIISDKSNTIRLNPEYLSLNNISNSSIINFFEEAGIHLDSFYKTLWKHIFVIALIKKKYNIVEEKDFARALHSLMSLYRKDPVKDAAVQYIQQWDNSFWIDEEYRLQQLTNKVEKDLSASVDLNLLNKAKLGAKGARNLSEEEKTDVIHHGQTVIVDKKQIRQLENVIKLLSENVFTDRNNPYYICIDSLDDDWAEDAIRFKLIKALFETIRSFKTMINVKIIITMRVDLIDSLFSSINSGGFQSEKYKGYFINMKWTKTDLQDLINKRVHHLFEYKYTKWNVSASDVIAKTIGKKQSGIEYIIDRTFFRPREVIAFFNGCLEIAEGKSYISDTDIKKAEYNYSNERVIALCEEWSRLYPYLNNFLDVVRGINDGVEVSHLLGTKFQEFCAEYSDISKQKNYDFSSEAANAYLDLKKSGIIFIRIIIGILYKVGVVGLKLHSNTKRVFLFSEDIKIDSRHIELTSKIYVHKAFWVALGIQGND
ncbi:P-loop ATPase, Sll1717 family [Acetobacter okinawensis]|uniref:P-loop ATPase, Sll1717 family n=1 Tax=Acetobacter okinawensis TaxID=1076594 RepID=UPI0039E7507A